MRTLEVKGREIHAERLARMTRWFRCPSEQSLASYVDSALMPEQKKRVECHLARCEYCRKTLSDVVRATRIEEAPLPLGLLQRAIARKPQPPGRWRWFLLPGVVSAAVAGLAVGALFLREPVLVTLPTPSAPAAPLISKSMPPESPKAEIHEIVRHAPPASLFPAILAPAAGSTVSGGPVAVRWKQIPHARYYEIRLVTAEGDLVWRGQSESTGLDIPSNIAMTNAHYFVWVVAYLDTGRVEKSPSVGFSFASH